MRQALAALALASASMAATHAGADDGDLDPMHRSPSHEHGELLLGAKGAFGLELLDRPEAEPDVVRVAAGGGAYVEDSLVAGWIELEVGVVAVRAEGETVLTLEPLLKKPFHLDVRVDLYVGVGPVLGLAFDDEGRSELVVGGLLALGAYLWVTDELGIDVDVTGQVAWIGEPAAELALGLGAVLRP